MNRKRIIFFATLILSSIILGQGRDSKINGNTKKFYMDEEFEITGNENFVGNGGPLIGAIMADLNSLNENLKEVGLPELKQNEYEDYNIIFMLGGGGIGGTFKNRFGGYGAAGRISNSNGDKKVTLDIEYGGFIYEKGILMIDTIKTNISLGFLAGGGTTTLSLVYDNIENDFKNVIGKPHTNILTKEYVLFAPRLNIHQKLGTFIGFDFSAEYLMNFDIGKSWVLDDEDITGPLANTQSPVFGARLSFGF